MKRIISIIMSVAMLAGLAACNTNETTETTVTEATTTETTETTAAPTTTETTELNSEGLKMGITEVARIVLGDMGDDYYISEFTSDTNKDENKKIGIINYLVISNKEFQLEKKIGEFDSYHVELFIAEFDMNSDVYKDLAVGKNFFVFEGGYKGKHQVAGIAKQFVISVSAALGKDGGFDTDNYETSAPFTVGKTQEGYDAFMELAYDPVEAFKSTTVADITYTLLKVLGPQYQTGSSFKVFNAEENKKLGILNAQYIHNNESKLSKKIDGFNCAMTDIYIFEFDRESDAFKSLSVGDKIFFFIKQHKESCIISAIVDRFAISVSYSLGNDNQYKNDNFVYEPPYKLSNVQAAYEAFNNLKPKEALAPEGVQKSIEDIFSELDKETTCTYISIGNEKDSKNNLNNGIKNSFIMTVAEGDINEYSATTFYILEFDMNSDQYKKVEVGKQVTFYNNNDKIRPEVLAINNQYVLIEYVLYFKDGKRVKSETEPPFTSESSNKIYEYFLNLK